MSRRVHVAALALALGGCADEKVEPVALGEVCGVAGPSRLFALAPEEVLRSRARPFAGQMFYPVARQYPPPGVAPYGQYTAQFEDTKLWASGPCGEDPRRVAEGVALTFTYDLWPDTLLGVRYETSDYVSIDPTSDEPRVLFPKLGRWTEHGLVTIDSEAETGTAMLLYPYPEDPRSGPTEPRVLLDVNIAPEYPLTAASYFMATEDAVFVPADGTLLRVALPDGARTVEQTDVLSFLISADGRYLLWQDRRLTNDNPERPEGAVILRDRTTGEGMSLAQTSLSYSGAALDRTDDGIITLTQRDGTVRVYFLPALDFVDLPYNLSLLSGPIADDRWLLQAWYGGPLYLTGLREVGEAVPFFGNGALVSVDDEGAIVLDVPPCCGEGQEFDEGPLWYAPFDGSPPRRLVDRFSRRQRRLDDGRLLTALDIDPGEIGDLWLVDPDSGEQQLIDRRVVASGSYWHTSEDIVRYPVVDGARSGVWIVRLPAR